MKIREDRMCLSRKKSLGIPTAEGCKKEIFYMNTVCIACGIEYSEKEVKELKILTVVDGAQKVFCKNCEHVMEVRNDRY